MIPVFVFVIFLMSTLVPPSSTDKVVRDLSLDVSRAIERVNTGIRAPLTHGDIVRSLNRNADPCTASGCLWPKSQHYVIVPVSISSSYTRYQRNFIIRSLLTFHRSTCIRFVWKRRWHRHYLHFFSGSGCWSYLGRQTRGQSVSLRSNGCLFKGTVQHEVLHALGFHHEQVRSDRDKYVRILFNNIQSGTESNFVKVQTNNLDTSYDFDSVMHYSKFAFSKNGKPTIVALRDPNIPLGQATEMSSNDINRINILYQCKV